MKGKYITKQLQIVCLAGKQNNDTDVHAALQQTISERKTIIKKMELVTRKANLIRLYLTTADAV